MTTPLARIVVAAAALLVLAPAAAPGQPPPAPTVSLPAGADLRAAVEALGTATQGMVVADATLARLTLTRQLNRAPLPEALKQICADFDCYWVRRGNLLALQNRGSTLEEGPGLEVEEVRAALRDMYRLLTPFVPPMDELGYTAAQGAFAHSLTTEQQQQMVAQAGLPFGAFPRDQRDLWIAITKAKVYLNDNRELRRAALCMAAWPRVTVVNLNRSLPDFPGTPGVTDLEVRFPDAAQPQGEGVFNLGVGLRVWRSRRPGGEGQDLPPIDERRPSSLRAAWKLPAQRLDLGDLPRRLREAGGPALATPEYARERGFWVNSSGTRADVLEALTLLWDWELTPREGGYRLDRPQFAPARDPVDLQVKLRALVPARVWNELRASWEGAGEPRDQQLREVLKAVDKAAGKGWKQFRVAQLEVTDQRRLANAVAENQLSNWYVTNGKQERPPSWLLFPERGILHLSEPLAPGKHPMLTVMIQEGPSDYTGWGWAVDTAQIIQDPPRR